MADIDNEKSGYVESFSKVDGPGAGSGETVVTVDVAEQKDSPTNSVPNVQSTASPNISSGATSSVASHPKKFSTVNINKKFMEKNSATPSASQPSSSFSNVKSGASNVKPVLQPAASHSRLVTTKLSTVLQTSSLTGPGWSRPSSVTPIASTSNSPPVPAGSTPPAVNSVPSHAAPQLPHVGKIIQPQPRGSTIPPGGISNGPDRPVWGRPRGSGNVLNTGVQNDFPTAAEVAQVRSARMVEKQEAAQSAAAQKQAMRAEADTFRGVHLDPNAHHWDEMEEDDDNFLGEVIDFGDGRQYTVQPVESQSSQQDGEPDQTQSESSKPPDSPSGLPVRKEDRFADDFDRSWPRSHQRSSISHREPPHVPSVPPQVLFNERSNRLEPYSGRQNAHLPARRGSRSDLPSPTDLRGGRDIPPHPPSQNVQLLQKSEGTAQRSRKYGAPEHPALDIDGPREKTSWRETTSPSSPMHSGRPPSQMSQQDQSRQWSRDFSGDTGRRASFSSAHSRDGGRQVSLHMSQMPPPTSPSVAGSAFRSPLLSRDDKLPPVSSGVPVSPSLSARSLASSIANPSNTSLPLVIDEETRQAAMHNAAERARIRRQQEEQNREEQKERARKKAAQLEAKLEAQKAAKAGEERKTQEQERERTSADELAMKPEAARATVLQQKDSETEENAKIVENLSQPVADTVEKLPTKPAWGRPPSFRGTLREPLGPSRPPATGRKSSNAMYTDPSPAAQTDSWRSKAAPLPPAPRSPKLEPMHLTLPPPNLVTQVDTFTVEEGEDIEVIDFSELGKFVGAPEPPIEQPERSPDLEKTESGEIRRREPPIQSKSDDASWRRGSVENHTPLQDNTKVSPIDLTKKGDDDGSTSVPSRLKINSIDHSNVASHFSAQRSPRANAFREASMSALDDAMSRIKGALDHMHEIPKEIQKETKNDDVKEAPTTLPGSLPIAPSIQSVQPASKPDIQRSSKWLPPALRPRDLVSNPFGLEREDPTTIRPPQSPKPAWNTFNVRLPKVSLARGQMTKRQLNLTKTTFSPFRWDILSWNPPVEGMNKKDLSLNDVLFRKPTHYKGKFRIRVVLPRKAQGSKSESLEPKVNIPNRAPLLKVPITGAFGRPRGADELSSWRRSEPEKQSIEVDAVLDTVSRSPPPVPSSELATAVTPSADVQLASADSIPRSRSQPKMPAGSDVGFYRPPQEEKATIVATGPVSFTVSSELDDRLDPSRSRGAASNTSYSESPLESESSPAPGLVQSKADSKSSDACLENGTITSPLQSTNTAWTKSSLTFPIKESTARGPDPEHLKIVWSKSENKDELPSINSLEGIADDFTHVPFTIQDVKSEDGETPPPIAPSRMSLSEVTRAFQQVPSRPDSTHPRSSHLSSPTPASNNRQSSYGLPPQASQPAARPPYGPYHSPVMNNSPVPVMYAQGLTPSPVPGRMMVSGHSPHYGQQLWMPVPAGPAGQSPGPMMRPVHSPFPAQVMSYPPPGSAMYGPPMTNGHNHMTSHQPNGTSQGRGRGAPMMSPMLSPVNPTPVYPNGRYPGSPVIMPSGMQGYPPPSGPMPSGGRGQLRNGFDNMSMLPSPIGPPQPPTYAPMPSYVRPAW